MLIAFILIWLTLAVVWHMVLYLGHLLFLDLHCAMKYYKVYHSVDDATLMNYQASVKIINKKNESWSKNKGPPPPLKSVTHILHWWNLAVIPYRKKIQKIHKSCDTSLEFCWNQHFLKSAIFSITGNTGIDSTNSFASSKIVLVNMAQFFMMPAKLATLGLLKIKVFWNKDCRSYKGKTGRGGLFASPRHPE